MKRTYHISTLAVMLPALILTALTLTACSQSDDDVIDEPATEFVLANGLYMENENYECAYRNFVQIGKTTQLRASAKFHVTPHVDWESLDESIATVDSEGRVTGVSEGYVYIKATDVQGHHAYTLVKVEPVSKVYDLKIAGFPITEYNRDHLSELPGVSGSIVLRTSNDILDLTDVNISLTDSAYVIDSDLSFLQINYNGNCRLATNGTIVIRHYGTFNLVGTPEAGTLDLISESKYGEGIHLAVNTDAQILGANINISAGYNGLTGNDLFKLKAGTSSHDCRLYFDSSNVTITTWAPATGEVYYDTARGCISDFDQITLNPYVYLTPANAVIGYPKTHHFLGRCVIDKNTGERYHGTIQIVYSPIAH